MALKILILNQPLCNRGDESAHKALVRSLLRDLPGAEIEALFLDRQQEDIEEFRVPGVKYTNLRTRKYFYKFFTGSVKRGVPFLAPLHPQVRSLLAKFRSADRIVCAPGGIELGGFRNWLHLATMHFAVSCNRSVAYFGRSIGPFGDDRFSRLAVALLKKMSFVSLRDTVSCKTAAAVDIPYISTLDSAFLVKPDSGKPQEKGRYAVVVPNSLVWHSAFSGIEPAGIDRFYTGLLSSVHEKYPDIEIILLPQLCGSQNDSSYLEKLASGLPYVRVWDCKTNSDGQQKLISGAEFLIGARYHSVVFSINNGTPFAALNYEHKIAGLLASLGLEDRGIAFGKEDLEEASAMKVLEVLDKPCPDRRREANAMAAAGYQKLLEWISR